jgi:hypothetical protein
MNTCNDNGHQVYLIFINLSISIQQVDTRATAKQSKSSFAWSGITPNS